MRHVIPGGLVAAALGAALVVASALPATAQIARPQSALAIDGSNGDLLTLVQDRRGGGGGGAARSGGGRSGGGAALRAGGGGREGARVSRASRGDSVRVSRASRDTRVARSGGREVRRFNNNNRRWTNNWRYNRYGYRYGYPYGYYGYGSGLAFGLALSAPYYAYGRGYYADGDAVAYCMSRFQSYDPASGTYLGFDGLRHPCP